MTWTRWCMVLYAVAMIVLGVYATAVHGEIMSLVGGGGAGAIVLGMMFWSQKNPRAAYTIALLVGLAVGFQFLGKFLKTHAVYPAGVITGLNAFLVAALLGGHLLAMASKKSSTAG